MATKIINFDDIPVEVPVTIIVKGVKHNMAAATVESFIANMKEIEELGLGASPIKEVETVVRIVARAFPTLTEEEIRQWPLSQIQAISELAQAANGEVVTKEGDEKKPDAPGNVAAAS